MACPVLQEQVERLQAEVPQAPADQQAADQAATAASNGALQEKVNPEREQMQQASHSLIQVLRRRQGLCWQHQMGAQNLLAA